MFKHIAAWGLAVLLAALFVLVGCSKILGPSSAQWALRLSKWGYPADSRYVIGTIEILAGVGLLLPVLRHQAAILLGFMMVGAFGTHLIYREWAHLLPSLLLAGLLYVLYRLFPTLPPASERD